MDETPDRADEDPTEALLIDYLVALEAGERPDADAFARRLPTDTMRAEFRALVDAARWACERFPETARAEELLAERYRLLHELGSGGFGKVWAAIDERLERPVAVKLLNSLSSIGDAQEVLERERRALALVEHPGVVGIRDVGEHDGRPFLVMDRVDGRPLDAVIASVRAATPRGATPTLDALRDAIGMPLPPGRPDLLTDTWWRAISRIMAEVLRALEAAHARGVVHRDLKPQNLLLRGGGHPVVLDFGIAALGEAGAGLVTGRLIGTPIYVAPEQIEAEQLGIDPRTDIYQVGLILYELMALRPAFDPKSSVTATLDAIRRGRITPPGAIEPGVPPALEHVCLRAIDPDPIERCPSAAEFAHDLERFARGEDPRTTDTEAPTSPAPLSSDDRFEIREEQYRDPRVVRWRAFDRLLECEVVLEQPGEVVAARLGTAAGARALREARALARVEHPGIVRLREVAWRDGLPLLVLEARAGEPLADVLARRGRLAPDEVIQIGCELAAAAHAAHAAGIVHRNIAATNVLIDPVDGRAILGGFGFAKPMDRPGGLSSIDHRRRDTGDVAALGLPDYAAPEQLAGQPADARTDVFALGCLLYRCVTGKEAFGEVEWNAPSSVRSIVPEAPKHLDAAIQRCLLRSPTARLPTMLALEDALRASTATRKRFGPRVWWAFASLLLLAGALLLALALGAFAG